MDILLALITAFLLAFVPAAFFSWFIYWLDRYEKEPKLLLMATFFWGGFIAIIGAVIASLIMDVGVSSVLNDESLASFASGSITAPVTEEFWKGLAVLVVFLLFRKEFDSILDGIIYGAIAGLGFAATENVLYLLGAFSEGGWGGMFGLFLLRVGIFAWGHPFYTAFTGIGFAVARTNKNILLKIIAPIIGYIFAVFAHSFHNSAVGVVGMIGGDNFAAGFIATILAEWFGWFVMLGFIIWMIKHEQGLLKKHLTEEVNAGMISQSQYNTSISFFQFGARLAALSAGTFRSTARFYQVCGELAHKKEQLLKFGDESGNTAIIASLRKELAELAPKAK
jgi:RsiW-degrading membrane proteinase PrsW (M82 family)